MGRTKTLLEMHGLKCRKFTFHSSFLRKLFENALKQSQIVNKEEKKGIKFQKLYSTKKSKEGSSWGDSNVANPRSTNPEESSRGTEESGIPLHKRDSFKPRDTGEA